MSRELLLLFFGHALFYFGECAAAADDSFKTIYMRFRGCLSLPTMGNALATAKSSD